MNYALKELKSTPKRRTAFATLIILGVYHMTFEKQSIFNFKLRGFSFCEAITEQTNKIKIGEQSKEQQLDNYRPDSIEKTKPDRL